MCRCILHFIYFQHMTVLSIFLYFYSCTLTTTPPLIPKLITQTGLSCINIIMIVNIIVIIIIIIIIIII